MVLLSLVFICLEFNLLIAVLASSKALLITVQLILLFSYFSFFLCRLDACLESLVNLTKSQQHRDFVEALKCRFCQKYDSYTVILLKLRCGTRRSWEAHCHLNMHLEWNTRLFIFNLFSSSIMKMETQCCLQVFISFLLFFQEVEDVGFCSFFQAREKGGKLWVINTLQLGGAVGDERCICIVFFLILLISDMKWMLMQIMIVFTFLFGLINFSYFIMPSYLIPKWLSIMLSFSFPLCAYWLDDSTHFPRQKCFLNY